VEPASGTVVQVFTTGTVVQVFLLARSLPPETWRGNGLGGPPGWTAADLLARIDRTWVDGDSRYQVQIHEIEAVAHLGVVVNASMRR
jgi:hypothetical protein